MMMNYELSRLCDGEMYVKNKYPSWSDVLDFLNILKKSSGSVNISITELVEKVANSGDPQAKSMLKQLLENSTVASIVGAGASALLGLL